MASHGLDLNHLSEIDLTYLYDKLGISTYLSPATCTRSSEHYQPATDRWKNGKLIHIVRMVWNVELNVKFINFKLMHDDVHLQFRNLHSAYLIISKFKIGAILFFITYMYVTLHIWLTFKCLGIIAPIFIKNNITCPIFVPVMDQFTMEFADTHSTNYLKKIIDYIF